MLCYVIFDVFELSLWTTCGKLHVLLYLHVAAVVCIVVVAVILAAVSLGILLYRK